VKSFPKDDASKPCHLTAFLGYKAGMTHIVRDLDKIGSKMHKKEIVEPVTIVDVPAMKVVGIVGYVETPKGLRTLTTVWAQHLEDQFRRRLYKNWYKSKKKAFTKHQKQFASREKSLEQELERIRKYCTVVRVIAHTDMKKVKLGQRKAHVMEIQVNGGDSAAKVEFSRKLLETAVPFKSVFHQNELVDIIAATRGHGFTGVTARWGTHKLPRKTHRGIRKVACIGAWHPSRVGYSVPRAGQDGYHHRTERNKKIYKIGEADNKANATTEFDLTDKQITPLGGFKSYGTVGDYVMLKGSIAGARRRVITFRQTLHPQTHRDALEEITLKFIDTSAKNGHGRFQTASEKAKFMGALKKKTAPTASAK